MTVLIVGSGGQLGHELARLAWDAEVVGATRSGRHEADVSCIPLDVSSTDAIAEAIARLRPRVVLNASAYTAVDRAESEPDLAFRINGDAPTAMARACAAIAARFVHFSTDYVFDGRGDRPYREDDPTRPVSVYGRSKLAGENGVQASDADPLIIRTSWVFSGRAHNFMRTMLRLGRDRPVLRVVADQWGCPTGAAMLARATRSLVAAPQASGIVHVAGAGATTWHAFAEAIFEEAHALGVIAALPTVEPITTADYPTPAARPAYSVLDCARALDLGAELPEWRESLREALGQLAPLG